MFGKPRPHGKEHIKQSFTYKGVTREIISRLGSGWIDPEGNHYPNEGHGIGGHNETLRTLGVQDSSGWMQVSPEAGDREILTGHVDGGVPAPMQRAKLKEIARKYGYKSATATGTDTYQPLTLARLLLSRPRSGEYDGWVDRSGLFYPNGQMTHSQNAEKLMTKYGHQFTQMGDPDSQLHTHGFTHIAQGREGGLYAYHPRSQYTALQLSTLKRLAREGNFDKVGIHTISNGRPDTRELKLARSFVYVSPSEREGSTWDQANAAYGDERHRALVALAEKLGAKATPGLGTWLDGAEETAVVNTEDPVRVGATLAKAFNQKSFGQFTPGEGPDTLHLIYHKGLDSAQVDEILKKVGLPFSTHVAKSGGTLTHIIGADDNQIAQLGVPAKKIRGTASFPGSESREEAQKVYDSMLKLAKFPLPEGAYKSPTLSDDQVRQIEDTYALKPNERLKRNVHPETGEISTKVEDLIPWLNKVTKKVVGPKELARILRDKSVDSKVKFFHLADHATASAHEFLAASGVSGKDWYEQSGKALDTGTKKLFQNQFPGIAWTPGHGKLFKMLLALTSYNTKPVANVNNAINALSAGYRANRERPFESIPIANFEALREIENLPAPGTDLNSRLAWQRQYGAQAGLNYMSAPVRISPEGEVVGVETVSDGVRWVKPGYTKANTKGGRVPLVDQEGRLRPKGWGTLKPEGLQKLQRLIAHFGHDYERTAQFLDTVLHPKQIKEVSGESVKGKEPVPGAFLFGPKFGAFYRNLNGDESHVTQDKWFSRLMGRLTGNVQEVPPNPATRQLWDRVARAVAERVGVSPASLQAILWYYEQNLYRLLGANTPSEDFVQGIKEALSRRKMKLARELPGAEVPQVEKTSYGTLRSSFSVGNRTFKTYLDHDPKNNKATFSFAEPTNEDAFAPAGTKTAQGLIEAPQILGKATSHMIHMVRHAKPDELYFDTVHPKLAKLYRHLAPQLAEHLPEYEMLPEETSDKVYGKVTGFRFRKKGLKLAKSTYDEMWQEFLKAPEAPAQRYILANYLKREGEKALGAFLSYPGLKAIHVTRKDFATGKPIRHRYVQRVYFDRRAILVPGWVLQMEGPISDEEFKNLKLARPKRSANGWIAPDGTHSREEPEGGVTPDHMKVRGYADILHGHKESRSYTPAQLTAFKKLAKRKGYARVAISAHIGGEPKTRYLKLAKSRAPAGGMVVNNQFYVGGKFLPRAFQSIRSVRNRKIKTQEPVLQFAKVPEGDLGKSRSQDEFRPAATTHEERNNRPVAVKMLRGMERELDKRWGPKEPVKLAKTGQHDPQEMEMLRRVIETRSMGDAHVLKDYLEERGHPVPTYAMRGLKWHAGAPEGEVVSGTSQYHGDYLEPGKRRSVGEFGYNKLHTFPDGAWLDAEPYNLFPRTNDESFGSGPRSRKLDEGDGQRYRGWRFTLIRPNSRVALTLHFPVRSTEQKSLEDYFGDPEVVKKLPSVRSKMYARPNAHRSLRDPEEKHLYMSRTVTQDLWDAFAANPHDDGARMILADHEDENGRPGIAELLRNVNYVDSNFGSFSKTPKQVVEFSGNSAQNVLAKHQHTHLQLVHESPGTQGGIFFGFKGPKGNGVYLRSEYPSTQDSQRALKTLASELSATDS